MRTNSRFSLGVATLVIGLSMPMTVFAQQSQSTAGSPLAALSPAGGAPQGTPAEKRIAWARKVLASDPKRVDAWNELALALSRRARETSDTSFYKEAWTATEKSLQLEAQAVVADLPLAPGAGVGHRAVGRDQDGGRVLVLVAHAERDDLGHGGGLGADGLAGEGLALGGVLLGELAGGTGEDGVDESVHVLVVDGEEGERLGAGRGGCGLLVVRQRLVDVVAGGDDEADRDEEPDEQDGQCPRHPAARSSAHAVNLAHRSVAVRVIGASLDCVIVSRPMRYLGLHPSAMLLGAQLMQVLLWPLLDGSVVGRAGLGAIGMLAVGAAVLAVRRTPNVSRVVLFLGVPAMALTLVEPLP